MVFGIIGVVAGLLAILLFGFISFDRVVKMQYEDHHAAWVDDGKPRGFYWRARECSWWDSGWAFSRLQMLWLFKTPEWANQSPDAQMWLRRYRLSILVWNVGFVLGAIFILVGIPHV